VGTRDPYRRIARLYDRIIEPMQAGVRQRALNLLPPEDGWQVLDVGCGTGTGMVPYLEAGCRVSGVDVSEAMLSRAASRLGHRADLHLTDGGSLPFPSDRFDLVTTSMVLHEIASPNRHAFVIEMARVAKPGGYLLFTDFHVGPLRGKGFLIRVFAEVVERLSGHHSGFRSFNRSGGVPAIVQQAGLEVASEKIVAGGNLGVYVVKP
jgi:ubiquinone/menaquinone biosynthesis C-methylase UbiE